MWRGGGLVWVWMLGFGWVGGLQGGVEGVGHGVFFRVCVFCFGVCFVGEGEYLAICRSGGVFGCGSEREGGRWRRFKGIEAAVSVWSRPGWQKLPSVNL